MPRMNMASRSLASRLIQQSCLKHGVQPEVLTLHSDRGAPMTSQCTAQLLADLGVTRSLSRPQVSDDNPFSEAQFKTLKYLASMKRLLDLTVAWLALILLALVMAVIGALVRLLLGSPLFFRQTRPGLHSKPFDLLKFRTMLDRRDAYGRPLPDSERLTRFGRFLRSTSLDELPELFNVVRGEMRLVGPRPLLMEYLEFYSPRQLRRHEVLPGITGWAQVNGRNALTWSYKFEMDLWYVENHSFWLDLKILALTLWKVVTREGVTQPGHDTVEHFQGNSGKAN